MSNEPFSQTGAGAEPPVAMAVAVEAAVAAQPARAAPVTEQDRLITLDVLRGVAVLGILLVNILTFAFTFTDFEAMRWFKLPPLDGAALLFIYFFAQWKFITIFSTLFGMGLTLQSDRARGRGASFGGLYVRRLIVLLVIGLAHGVLLWYGDVLSLYAALGFIALVCRNVRPQRLLIAAVVLFLVPFVVFGGCMMALPDQNWTDPPDWEAMAEEMERSDAPSDRGAMSAAQLFRFMADEVRVYQSGTWAEMVGHRTLFYICILLYADTMIIGWRCLALFFLGIYLIRRGLFDDSDRHAGTYRRMVLVGLAIGVPVQLVGAVVQATASETASAKLIEMAASYLGSAGLSVGYMGIVALACLRFRGSGLLGRLAAVGRMALTNYLAHSVICGLIFYSYGLGLFKQIGHAQAFLIVLAIFAAQLVISPIWLGYFRFGPVEWLWRSLTYWRLQPVLRRDRPG